MDQLSFSDAEYQRKRRPTRREKFLAEMDQLVPWKKLEKRLAQPYPKGERGRPPYPLSVMLRIHCMQLFYNLSDPAMEDALLEIDSMRRFAGLNLSSRLPDETTILNFRRFLEKHNLSKVIFDTIISAPSSTKNKEKTRDPVMHQTKKGNEWHFGMKMHIGVDAATGVIHRLETTAANAHDLEPSDKLFHGSEEYIFADAGYQGMAKRPEHNERTA
ncbi:MAG: transposase [Natronospirillum sp.]